jgi:flavin-dependent dehydrogenase
MRAGDAEFRVPHETLGEPGVAPRRTILDRILADAAREAGAEVREEFSVTKILKDDAGAVIGVEGHGPDGEPVTEHARIVVGADGRNSFLARHVDAPKYNEKPGVTCGYYSYFTGVEQKHISLDFQPDRAIFVFPSNHGQVCLGVEAKTEHFERFRSDIDGFFAETFARIPGKESMFVDATRVERWMGANQLPNFYRKPYGPGWALVGDAGYVKDPILGQGINDAFRDATALAGAIHAGLTGGRPMDEALAQYQRDRDAATAMFYEVNYMMSQMGVTAQHIQMLQMGFQQQAEAAAQKAGAAAG